MADSRYPSSSNPRYAEPNERSTSSERKRRHTDTTDSAMRRGFPRRRDMVDRDERSRANMERSLSPPISRTRGYGSSSQAPIDLTDSPQAPTSQRPLLTATLSDETVSILSRSRAQYRFQENSTSPRRDSDLQLPAWQPDADVTACSVCEAEFSFWYRKHHCRKCGKVVCSSCSPHRITIPRQYIVQPPNAMDYDNSPASPRRNQTHLGGGEVVRVCNPCVPDPWTPESAAEAPNRPPWEAISTSNAANRPRAPYPWHRSQHGTTNDDDAQQPIYPWHRARAYTSNDDDSQQATYRTSRARQWDLQPVNNNNPINPLPPRDRSRRTPPLTLQRREDAFAHFFQPSSSISRSLPQRDDDYDSPHLPDAPNYWRPNNPHSIAHRYSQSTGAAQAAAPPPRPPRRVVREEDECPVCGIELAPGEAVREAHISTCISERFSGTPPAVGSTAANAVPAPRIAPWLVPGAFAPQNAPSAVAPTAPPGSRPRATSYRPRGMAIYTATEKDCTTTNSHTNEEEPVECIICFEEFQVGDELGRMECLCKFHRRCIRHWWDTKGTGMCPTHMLHD